MIIVLLLFLFTCLSIICTAYNILVNWERMYSEKKYIRLAILLGLSIILNIMLIVGCFRAFYR